MEECASMMEHVSTFNKCIADLQRMDEVYKSEDKVVIFLTFLPLSYKHFRMTLMFGKGTLKYEDVMQNILTYHRIVPCSGDGSQGEGLVARTGGRDHSSKRRGKSSNGENSRSEDNEGCLKCGLKDHWKQNCPI
ncbi:unnamed protein product [Prunus brigantina]